MYLTIALRKEVVSVEQAQALTNLVAARIAEYPEIDISASVSENIKPEEPTG